MLLWTTCTASGVLPSGGGKLTVAGPGSFLSTCSIGWACRFQITLGTAPVTLSNQETTRQDLGVDLAGRLIHNRLFCLDDSAGLSLVIDTNDLVAQLKLPSSASRRKRFQDSDLTLTINAMAVIQLWDTGDMGGLLARIEISHLPVGELKGCMIRFELVLTLVYMRFVTYGE